MIKKSILTLFVAGALLASCSSNQTVANTASNTAKTVAKSVINTATEDTVKFVDGLQSATQAKLISVDIEYSATEERQINAEIKSADNKWLGGTKIIVPRGSGTKTLKLWSKNMLDKGDNYNVGVSIRPIGGTWKDNIKRQVIKAFSIK